MSENRYYPMLNFGVFEATQRFCQTVNEVGNVLRGRTYMPEFVSLADHRARFLNEVEDLEVLFHAA